MAKKKKNQSPDQLEAVENVLTRTEQFVEDNQKKLTTVVLIILAAVTVFMGVRKYYIRPMQDEALSQMYVAEQYFEADSFNLALWGDGSNYGFMDIIDEYGLTKQGNLAKYYAGISYLYQKEYEECITYLKKFKKKDGLQGAVAYGVIGDAYWELDDPENALQYYLKAADYNDNDFTAPFYMNKAGYVYESMGEHDKAVAIFQKVKDKYPESEEGYLVDKNIMKNQILLNKN